MHECINRASLGWTMAGLDYMMDELTSGYQALVQGACVAPLNPPLLSAELLNVLSEILNLQVCSLNLA